MSGGSEQLRHWLAVVFVVFQLSPITLGQRVTPQELGLPSWPSDAVEEVGDGVVGEDLRETGSDREREIVPDRLAGAEWLLTDQPSEADPELSRVLGELGDWPDEAAENQAAAALAAVLPEEFWDDYFASPPGGPLVDPRGLLGEGSDLVREELAFHTEESAIDLLLYVFQNGEELPAQVRFEEMLERFGDESRPAIRLFYFLGDPARTRLDMSVQLDREVPWTEPKKAIESATIQASRFSDPIQQLAEYLRQISIRSYWIEKLVVKIDANQPIEPGEAESAEAAVHRSPRKAGPVQQVFAAIPQVAWNSTAVLLAGGAGLWIAHQRRRYRFPKVSIEPRLGGANAAGVGEKISFASASLPPSVQKHALPEPIKRGQSQSDSQRRG